MASWILPFLSAWCDGAQRYCSIFSGVTSLQTGEANSRAQGALSRYRGDPKGMEAGYPLWKLASGPINCGSATEHLVGLFTACYKAAAPAMSFAILWTARSRHRSILKEWRPQFLADRLAYNFTVNMPAKTLIGSEFRKVRVGRRLLGCLHVG